MNRHYHRMSIIFILLLFCSCSTRLSDAILSYSTELHEYGFFSPDDLISPNTKRPEKRFSEKAIQNIQCKLKTANPVLLGIQETELKYDLSSSKDGKVVLSEKPLISGIFTTTTETTSSFKVSPILLSMLPEARFNPEKINPKENNYELKRDIVIEKRTRLRAETYKLIDSFHKKDCKKRRESD